MLVLDVLRHVLQDQPVHLVAGDPLWSTLQTRWDLSYDPPKKWATQFLWHTAAGGFARTEGGGRGFEILYRKDWDWKLHEREPSGPDRVSTVQPVTLSS